MTAAPLTFYSYTTALKRQDLGECVDDIDRLQRSLEWFGAAVAEVVPVSLRAQATAEWNAVVAQLAPLRSTLLLSIESLEGSAA